MSSLAIEGFDVKALRAFRVLRPLRLVSGVPSKFLKHLLLPLTNQDSTLPSMDLMINFKYFGREI